MTTTRDTDTDLVDRQDQPRVPAPAERAWMAHAACLGADPDTFFPVGQAGPGLVTAREATAICRQCAVREQCLSYALVTGSTDGIWGGLTERERRALRRTTVLPGRGFRG